jgi:hypothetical protein
MGISIRLLIAALLLVAWLPTYVGSTGSKENHHHANGSSFTLNEQDSKIIKLRDALATLKHAYGQKKLETAQFESDIAKAEAELNAALGRTAHTHTGNTTAKAHSITSAAPIGLAASTARAAGGASKRLPIVYVYTVVPAVCKHGLPEYIKFSLEQAQRSQPDCDVILAANFGECPKIREKVENITGLITIDTNSIASNRTLEFENVSRSMFEADYGGELWVTSACRFFSLEDIFITYGYTEMMHIEADNLLYGRLTSILPEIRLGYKGMAATPLNANKSFITASVLWLANLDVLKRFNDFLLELGRNTKGRWNEYLRWLRPFGCCKKGGIDPDANGEGIKPFAVNEMSMLAFYHHIRPAEFLNFPVVPVHNYVLNRHVVNMSDFGPGGTEVGIPTGVGIWDPNSWVRTIDCVIVTTNS